MTARTWCNQKILVTLRGPLGEQQFCTPGPFARIGRHPRSEVVLADGDLPDRAFYLHATDDGIYCLQLWIEASGVPPRDSWLIPGEILSIGSYVITAALARTDLPDPTHTEAALRDATQSEATIRPGPAGDLRAAGPDRPLTVVLAVNAPHWTAPRRLRIPQRLVLLGRCTPSDIRIKSNSISRVHVVLYWDDKHLWYVDLLSLNGTRRGGVRTDNDRLRSGQVLKLEQVRIWYERIAIATKTTDGIASSNNAPTLLDEPPQLAPLSSTEDDCITEGQLAFHDSNPALLSFVVGDEAAANRASLPQAADLYADLFEAATVATANVPIALPNAVDHPLPVTHPVSEACSDEPQSQHDSDETLTFLKVGEEAEQVAANVAILPPESIPLAVEPIQIGEDEFDENLVSTLAGPIRARSAALESESRPTIHSETELSREMAPPAANANRDEAFYQCLDRLQDLHQQQSLGGWSKVGLAAVVAITLLLICVGLCWYSLT